MPLNRTQIEIKGKLIARNARASDDWISACVDFFLSELGDIPISGLIEKVHEQWLLADLRDVGTRSLPPNLDAIRNTEVKGKHILQINGVQDISQPAYAQIQKIRKQDIENVEFSNQQLKNDTNFWEPKSSRCMMFALTDGEQDIKGMEVEKLLNLALNVIPGTKIVIQGPVECRRGILMLKAKHVTAVLGGEVDSLVITNAAENILARKLNLPENPTPYANDALLGSSSADTTSQNVGSRDTELAPSTFYNTAANRPLLTAAVAPLAVIAPMEAAPSSTRSHQSSNQRGIAASELHSRVPPPPQIVDLLDDEDDFDLEGVDIDSVIREAEWKHLSGSSGANAGESGRLVGNQSEQSSSFSNQSASRNSTRNQPASFADQSARVGLREGQSVSLVRDSLPKVPCVTREEKPLASCTIRKQDARPNLGSLKQRMSSELSRAAPVASGTFDSPTGGADHFESQSLLLELPGASGSKSRALSSGRLDSLERELAPQSGRLDSLNAPSVVGNDDCKFEHENGGPGFKLGSYEWKVENFILVRPVSFGRVVECYNDDFKAGGAGLYLDKKETCAWFKVNAYFTTIVTKLMVDRPTMTWTMSIKVSDGETSITAELHHDVVEYLLQMSPLDVRKRMKDDPAEFKCVLDATKEKCKRRLTEINSAMIFAWPVSQQRPVIMEIEELTKEKCI